MSGHGAVHARRRRFMLALLLLGGVLLLGRGLQVQVLQAAEWDTRAERQQRETVTLPAERGTIYDRNGVPLAATREVLKVSVAPRELRDADAVRVLLRDVLDLDARTARNAVDPARRWVVLPGRYELTIRGPLRGVDGVYLERRLERFYPHGDVARPLLGSVSRDGRPLGGLETVLDSLLRGEDGSAIVRRNAQGDPIPGALIPVRDSRPGLSVRLTLDLGLQEIAEQALREAVAEHEAAGGDLIFADPRTGEILAAASQHPERGRNHWPGLTDAYEPGSTMKPFVLAALLERGLVSLDDSVDTENGQLRRGARTISDVERHATLTAAGVVRHSSNVGIVKLSDRLSPTQQYETFRDFGFGTPTGLSYPSESSGRLTRPARWSGYSQASMAMGYEVAVTPLQMTMAYGALANGGRLMEPRLVREVRGADGLVVERREPRVVRHAVSDEVANAMAEVLGEVVEEGTGRNAGLGSFRVAGKTGTAWVFENGSYQRGAYTASFAGFFPVRDPQLVFLVKLDRGSDYGGSIAAPVTRSTLGAALAARASVLDRSAMATSSQASGTAEEPGTVPERPWRPVSGPFVFRTQAGAPRRASPPTREVRVPDVRGESGRDAAAMLHAAGFRVTVVGAGRVEGTEPRSGLLAERGTTVRLMLGRSR
ncbi:MAG TPA: penicillin-binding transpeptidase domain-containing protein [Longimicrobiales bacterium]|nr:penicillin-binding transpeptidase domain-containing protein [Longimicrobiales bacterium]